MTNQLMTAGEFATELRLKERTIRRWISDRRIATVKIGASVRIPSRELARVIRQGARPAGASK